MNVAIYMRGDLQDWKLKTEKPSNALQRQHCSCDASEVAEVKGEGHVPTSRRKSSISCTDDVWPQSCSTVMLEGFGK